MPSTELQARLTDTFPELQHRFLLCSESLSEEKNWFSPGGVSLNRTHKCKLLMSVLDNSLQPILLTCECTMWLLFHPEFEKYGSWKIAIFRMLRHVQWTEASVNFIAKINLFKYRSKYFYLVSQWFLKISKEQPTKEKLT